jgi:hypothetical protein
LGLCNQLKNKSATVQFDFLVELAKKNSAYEYGSFYLKNATFA